MRALDSILLMLVDIRRPSSRRVFSMSRSASRIGSSADHHREQAADRHDGRDRQQLLVAEPGEQEPGDDRRARRAGAPDAEHEAGAGGAGIGREALAKAA